MSRHHLAAIAAAAAFSTAAPAAPASTGVQHFRWGRAVPISTHAPRWFTARLYERVLAAGARGVPLSKVAALKGAGGKSGGGGGASGGGSGACLSSAGAGPTGSTVPSSPNGIERPPVGIGPGTWLISLFCASVGGQAVPDGFAWCTANFVFQNGTALGLGTAGHCAAKDALASPVTAVVQPPPEVCANGGSCAPGLYAIGTFRIVHNNGLGDDFALIQLYPQFNAWVRPTMPVFGGPTGPFLTQSPLVAGQTLSGGGATVLTPGWSPAVLGQCGHGAAVGTGGTCRTHTGLFQSGTWYAWYGPSFEGDSGSGVEILGNPSLANGGAVPAAADLTHIIISDARVGGRGVTEGPDQPGMVGGTQMSKILSIVGSSWQLVPGGLP
jgi:hypothetical protein